jgi:hypothetical protein
MTDTYLMPNKQMAAAMLSPLRTVLTFVLGLSLLLLGFWAVCLFLYFGPWQHDARPLAGLFHSALTTLAPGQPLGHMAGWASEFSAWLHRTLFVVTGIEAMQHAPAVSSPGVARAVETVLAHAAPGFGVVILATQVFGLRLAMLLGMLPLVLLCHLVAQADGHAERVIRRACAGRESATRYHRAKYLQYGALGLLLIVTLCLPVHVDPLRSMLAFALVTALLARMQWAYYKKYL